MVGKLSIFYYYSVMAHQYLERKITNQILGVLNQGKSILLLGPRQTGKTTLVKTIAHDRYLNLMYPDLRQRYESTPELFIAEIKALHQELSHQPLVIIDEIQKVPVLTDCIQLLIDEKVAKFILTGSSARRLSNLLPGRVIKFSLRPLAIDELGKLNVPIEQILTNGLLPGIISNPSTQLELNSYVSLYLEEEVRKEALVRNLGAFHNFLKLACIESGQPISFRAISQEIGVNHNTVSEYYRILQDCMLVETITPITISYTRRKLAKHPKYFIFDLGVRRIGAMEPIPLSSIQIGKIFEQFVGLELVKIIETRPLCGLHYWRDHAGAEIDYVVIYNECYTPIEVKWTAKPTLKDARHILKFQQEYANTTKQSYIICNTPYAVKITERIVAWPWNRLHEIKFFD